MDKIVNTRNYDGGDFYEQVEIIKDLNIKYFNQYNFNNNKSFKKEEILDILNNYDITENVKNETETVNGSYEIYNFYFSKGLCVKFIIKDIIANDEDEDENDFEFNLKYDLEEDEENIIKDTPEQEIKNISLYYDNSCIEKKNRLVKDINNAINKDERTYFYTIGVTRYGYNLEKHEVVEHTVDININYGDSFNDKYENMLTSLETSNEGLYLLWGEPGTGKTTLIRKMIGDINKFKKVIYIPSFMMEHLSKPEFIGFLKSYKNMVLLLEDAEHAIKDRLIPGADHGAVSNILNMTAGLLNDIIKVQIIATFNTKRENIDKALLREGRLKYEHEFKLLTKEESQKVIDNLGIDYKAEDDMSLAQIYNLEEFIERKDNNKSKQIGFGR